MNIIDYAMVIIDKSVYKVLETIYEIKRRFAKEEDYE